MPVVDLNAREVQALRQAGIPQQYIRAYQLGGFLPVNVKQQINSIIVDVATSQPAGRHQFGGSFDQPAVTPFAVNPYGGYQPGSTTNNPLSNPPSAMNSSTGSTAAARIINTFQNPSPPRSPWGQNNPWAGSGGAIPNRRGLPTGPVDPVTAAAADPTDPGTYSLPDPTNPNSIPNPTPPVYDSLPPPPTLPDLNVPQIVLHDFMPQATEAMTAAYAPLFAGIEASRANTQQQGDRSQALTGGAYDAAISDLASRAAATDQANQQAQAANTQQGAQLGQALGQNYMGNTQATADVLKGLGIQAAAPQVLGDAANQASWQQGQAAQSTANQANYLTNQNAADQKYATDMQDVMSNQKARNASDIANAVAQNLFNLDQIKTGYDSEKIQKAIEMAMNLQSQDIGLQQTNAQNSITAQQQSINNILETYKAQVAASNASNANKSQAFNDILALQKQVNDTFNNDFNNKLKLVQTQMDQENAQNKLILDATQGGSSSGSSDAPKIVQSRAYWSSQGGNNAAIWDAMFKVAQELGNSSITEGGPTGVADIVARARAAAVAHNATSPQDPWDENLAAQMMVDIIQNSGFKAASSGGSGGG